MNLRPISNGGTPAFAAELRSLEAEGDAELQAQGLYHLARRAEARHQYAFAADIYRRLEGTPLAERAAERLRVFAGEGNVGNRAEFLISNFSREAFNPSMLFAMGSAGALFKATRLLTLSRLAAAPASAWSRGFAARALAAGTGFGVEAAAFPAAGRLANEALGQRQDWSARALSHDLAASVLVLGGMKLGGFGASTLAQRIGSSAPLSPLIHGLFQQSGMFGGILLGQRFEEWAGLRQPVSGASALVDALALQLNFNVAGRLLHGAMGEGFRRWEQSAEWQTRALDRPSFFSGGSGNLWGGRAPAFATAGIGTGGGEVRPTEPNFMMMKGGSEAPVRRLPWRLEASLLAMRSGDRQVWESHLALLEQTLLDARLPSREYVNLYRRLHAELGEDNNAINREINLVLSELLSRIRLDRPGPQALFERMIHIERFPDYSLGDTLAAWARNPTLESKHRRRMLQLTEDLIQDQPKDYGQEAINFLASNWIRFSGEGRVFRRAADAALRFIQDREAWFDPNLDGIQIARLMLLDPETASRSRDLLLNQLQAGLHSNNLLSSQRVKLMQTLEGLAQRSDLNESQRELFFSRLPIWRNEFLHFNSQRGIRDRVSHHAELAYLLTQDYVVASQKRRFAQAWQRAFFEASPDSKAYELMIGDALTYLSNPNLTPEIRRAFVIPLLKALNDSVGRRLEPHQRYVEDMNREYLVDRITSLPEEERIGLANVLIDEMTRRDVRAERASVLIGTLAGLITPTAELYRRMNHTVENATHPQARGIAREVLQHWQSLN